MIRLSNLFLLNEGEEEADNTQETKELLEAVVEGFGDWVNNNSVGLYPGIEFDSEEQLQRIGPNIEFNRLRAEKNTYYFSTKLFSSKETLSSWNGVQLKDPQFSVLVRPTELFFRVGFRFAYWYKAVARKETFDGDLVRNQTAITFNVTDVNEWYRVYETKLKEFENKIFLELSEIREEEIRAQQQQ